MPTSAERAHVTTRTAPSIAALEGAHDFPCPYTVKAFGPHEQSFVDAVREAAVGAGVAPDRVTLTMRPSSKGTYCCVTVSVPAPNAEWVQVLYEQIVAIPGLRTIL